MAGPFLGRGSRPGRTDEERVTKRSALAAVSALLLALGFAGSAQAAVVVDLTPGTAAAPSTLGRYAMTSFPLDNRPFFDDVTTVASPLGGVVSFDAAVSHRRVPDDGWATSWSHGYTGDVYFSGGTTRTLTLPATTTAFYFYTEADALTPTTVTAVAQDGTSSGPVSVATGLPGESDGAKYIGFYATGSDRLSSIKITYPGDVSGFAVGEFGISVRPNEAPTVEAISGAASASEGDQKTYSVSASDPDGDRLSYAWSITGGSADIIGPSNASSVDVRFTDGPSTVGLKVEVSDGQGHTETKTLNVDEANVAPTLSSVTLTAANATSCAKGTNVMLAVAFSDPAGSNDAYTGVIDWGDGSPNSSFTSSPVREPHVYAAGTHTVKVDVTDEDGGSATPHTFTTSLTSKTRSASDCERHHGGRRRGDDRRERDEDQRERSVGRDDDDERGRHGGRDR